MCEVISLDRSVRHLSAVTFQKKHFHLTTTKEGEQNIVENILAE